MTGPSPQPPPPPAALRVISVTPNSGSSLAATPIRINGTGFLSEAIVRLDDVPTATTFVSSTILTVVAPPHALGPIDVVVINPAGESSRLERGFTYVKVLTSLTFSGNTGLTAVGETSQLTATAGYDDNTTADVTKESLWSTSDATIATVTNDGVLTARGLGRCSVFLRYPATAPSNSFLSRIVVVTPEGTFTATGWTRQPGGTTGPGTGALAGVLVRHVASGVSVLTEQFGGYSLVGLAEGQGRLAFSKADYESVEIDATPNGFDDVPMQRVVRIEPGSAPQARTLAPNDVAYDVAPGTRCEPCKLIRIISETSDTARVRLTWTSNTLDLNLWVNGQMFPGHRAVRVVEAGVPVVGGGEAIIFVGTTAGPGSFNGHQPFTLTVTPGG